MDNERWKAAASDDASNTLWADCGQHGPNSATHSAKSQWSLMCSMSELCQDPASRGPSRQRPPWAATARQRDLRLRPSLASRAQFHWPRRQVGDGNALHRSTPSRRRCTSPRSVRGRRCSNVSATSLPDARRPSTTSPLAELWVSWRNWMMNKMKGANHVGVDNIPRNRRRASPKFVRGRRSSNVSATSLPKARRPSIARSPRPSRPNHRRWWNQR